MPNYGIFNEKDIDGRWWKFDHQQLGNSCTIASSKVAKEYYHNKTIGEEALRNLATLFESGGQNTGQALIGSGLEDARDWENEPGYKELTIQVLKAQPLPIPAAKIVASSVPLLKAATRNKPVLIGWSWT